MNQAREFALRLLGPEWKQKIGEAPVDAARPDGTVGGVLGAPRAVGDVILRRAVGDRVADRGILRQFVGIDVAGRQEAEMRGVGVAFGPLQKVAVALVAG